MNFDSLGEAYVGPEKRGINNSAEAIPSVSSRRTVTLQWHACLIRLATCTHNTMRGAWKAVGIGASLRSKVSQKGVERARVWD